MIVSPQLLQGKAKENLLALAANPYPGRGIIVGMDKTGQFLIQVYWIMGRSENTRNRIFVLEGTDTLKTAAADPQKVTDPSLIIYTAMTSKKMEGRHNKKGIAINLVHVVSNGHQTTDVLNGVDGEGLNELLRGWQYEPDAPNFTPRITATCSILYSTDTPFTVEMSIIKKSPCSEACERSYFRPPMEPGLGYCLTTYRGDGKPLPSFEGKPYVLPLMGNIKDVANRFFYALNEDNKVSVGVKFIDIQTGMSYLERRNKYQAIQ
jgi:hypothetical protein